MTKTKYTTTCTASGWELGWYASCSMVEDDDDSWCSLKTSQTSNLQTPIPQATEGKKINYGNGQ